MGAFEFKILKGQSRGTSGRLGEFSTVHGTVSTPCFMPVGTAGTVKATTPEELLSLGVEIVLANTYHLHLRPGHMRIKNLGGLHKFMHWARPILTDSGGYQVFSLADLRRKFTDDGVEFQSHIDGGERHFLSPELTIEIQEALGSDIMMVFDECTPYPASESQARASMDISLKWAARCLAARKSENALFGIVQGGMYPHLRLEYIKRLEAVSSDERRATCHGFDGFAIGGLSVGEPIPLMHEMVGVCVELLPRPKPRYLMGVGTPEDIVECIDLGVDMFDCVIPTRNARNGQLFTSKGNINIANAAYADDPRPIDEHCACYACKNFSRAYLRHLFLAREILAARLATLHNLQFYFDLIGGAHSALKADSYPEFKRKFLETRKEKSCL